MHLKNKTKWGHCKHWLWKIQTGEWSLSLHKKYNVYKWLTKENRFQFLQQFHTHSLTVQYALLSGREGRQALCCSVTYTCFGPWEWHSWCKTGWSGKSCCSLAKYVGQITYTNLYQTRLSFPIWGGTIWFEQKTQRNNILGNPVSVYNQKMKKGQSGFS